MKEFLLFKKLSNGSANSLTILLMMTIALSGCERVTEQDIRGACAELSTTLKIQEAERLAIIHVQLFQGWELC